MNALKLFTTLFLLTIGLAVQSQSHWSLRNSFGVATEQNNGDTGLRLSSRLIRHYGRWNVLGQVGFFQMFHSNENWKGDNRYRERRSLSTANIDLGAGFTLVNKSRVRLSADLAGSYRAGRQLWPEFSEDINGFRVDFYTFTKISEIGYAMGLDLSLKATDRLWISLDLHNHSYNFFGEYMGVGIGATVIL